jgi:hypothetical protein
LDARHKSRTYETYIQNTTSSLIFLFNVLYQAKNISRRVCGTKSPKEKYTFYYLLLSTKVKIAGIQQSTMIDYPGKIACVVFTQ